VPLVVREAVKAVQQVERRQDLEAHQQVAIQQVMREVEVYVAALLVVLVLVVTQV
jgi:hypothetical protein